MIAVGVDVHKRQCTVAIQREDGELKCFGPMANTREGWGALLQQLPPDTEIALEVSTSGYFAMRVLEEAGWRERAHGVHTAGIDIRGRFALSRFAGSSFRMDSSAISQTRCLTVHCFRLPYSSSYSRVRSSPAS